MNNREMINQMFRRLRMVVINHPDYQIVAKITEDKTSVALQVMIGDKPLNLVRVGIIGLSDEQYEQTTDLLGALEQVATAYIEGGK